MAGAKVIGIHGGEHPNSGEKVKPLPALLANLRELKKRHVHGLLRKLFDGADDALFAMADKAGTNNEQTMYFDAMRELRLQKKHIATSVVKALIRSFNEMGRYRPSVVGDESSGKGAEELSLVQNDDLEVRVAVEGMSKRLRANAGNSMEELHHRIEYLMGIQNLAPEQLPGGPEVLCDGFVEGCEQLEIDIRAQLVVLKLFERFVLVEMVPAYRDANRILIEQGVRPTITTQRGGPRGQPQGAPAQGQPQQPVDLGNGTYYEQAHPSMGAPNAPMQGGQSMGMHGGGGYPVPQGASAGPGRLDDLRDLLHHAQGAGGVGVSAEPPTLSNVYYSQQELVGALSAFQAASYEQHEPIHATRLLDFRALLSQQLPEDQCKADYSEMDSDVINLVSMLFEFILDDRQLQSEMKALIGRLQIPILKVALMDKAFFDKGGHPARQLLNEIAGAALGWNPPAEGKADRLKDKIEAVVQRILSGFDDNIELFQELYDDFRAFVDVEQRRGQLVEQRTKDSEQGKVANELARIAAQDNLNESLKGHHPADEVMELLRDGWSSVMVLHYLKEGEQSKPWSDACSVVDELLWTLNPTPLEEGTRTKLLKLIPSLMQRLRTGLKEVSFDEFKTKALLKAVEDQHVQALQRLQAAIVEQQMLAKDNARSEATSQNDLKPTPEQVDIAAKRQRELEKQDDAIADLVRSTLELESDFNSMQSRQADEALGSASSDEPMADDNAVATSITDHVDSADKVDSANARGASVPAAAEKAAASSKPDVIANEASAGDSLTQPTEDAADEEIVLVSVEPSTEAVQIDENDPFVQQVGKFAVGCWFEFQGQDKTERCKLAAIIKATDKYIFVNRAGVKVAEKSKMALAVELRRGSIQILNDGLLFDRALESIITNLRSKSS